MTTQSAVLPSTQLRASLSRGISNAAIYAMVQHALAKRNIRGRCLVDIGCGSGNLHSVIGRHFGRYVGVDAVRYEGLPAEIEFLPVDLNSGTLTALGDAADVVVAVETIEHLENPRAFMRTLFRIARPGGWVIVTTPNQLSLLSLLTLLLKHRFQAFQDVHYPAHLTALLEIDLTRIASECGLVEVEIEHSLDGRIPLTARHYPALLSQCFPRALSENVLVIGKRPSD